MSPLLRSVREARAALDGGDAPAAAKLLASSELANPAAAALLPAAEREELRAEVDAFLAAAERRQRELSRELEAGATARRAEARYRVAV